MNPNIKNAKCETKYQRIKHTNFKFLVPSTILSTVWVCTYVCIQCVHVCIEVRGHLGCCSSGAIHLGMRGRISNWPRTYQ